MKNFHKAIALIAILFAVLEAKAQAPIETSATSLRLEDAIRNCLQYNPQLAGYEFRAKALQGERQTAELKPLMRVSAHMENIAGSGDFKGGDSGEFTLSLSSVIERNQQRDARLGLVTARQQQLDSEQRLLTLDVLTQLTQQFIALAKAQEQLKLLQQTQQVAQANFDALNKQVQIGRTPEAEILRAKVTLAKANLSIKKTQQEFAGERLKLSAFWAETTPTFNQVQADLFNFSNMASLATLIGNLDKNPDLAVLGNDIFLRAAELRQAQAEQKTNIEWSAGVRRLQASDDSALVVGVSMPLGAASRASGAILTASANHAQAEQTRDATRTRLHAQLTSLYGAYENALSELNSLRNDILPSQQQALAATSNAFNRGRYSYFELNLAQRELLDTQLAIVESAAHAHTLRTEIERLTGSSLTTEPLSRSDLKTQP